MKKIIKIAGVAVFALALFTNLNTNKSSEAEILALSIAQAQVLGDDDVKCRDTGIKTDYCYINQEFKFKCANNDIEDNCGEGDDPIITF